MEAELQRKPVLSGELQEIRDRMLKSIIGQTPAVEHIVDSLGRFISGLQDRERPLLTLLLLGPTGVGKTETVKILAEVLFGSRRALTKVNCQEYSAHYNISKLLGSPPGYVGGEIRPILAQENIDRHHLKARENCSGLVTMAGGKLAEMFPPECDRNLSIVLFDEIEKAHPKLWNLLLGLLEDGTVVLGTNEEVDFRNSIVVCTTNVGSKAMGLHLSGERIGFSAGEEHVALSRDIEIAALREAKKIFPTEWLNRMDGRICFHPLMRDHMFEILNIMVAQVHHRSLRCEAPFLLELTPEAKGFLVDTGTNQEEGARCLRRQVESEIVTPISHMICSDQLRRGDLLTVDLLDDRLVFKTAQGASSWGEIDGQAAGSGDWGTGDLGVKDCSGVKAKPPAEKDGCRFMAGDDEES